MAAHGLPPPLCTGQHIPACSSQQQVPACSVVFSSQQHYPVCPPPVRVRFEAVCISWHHTHYTLLPPCGRSRELQAQYTVCYELKTCLKNTKHLSSYCADAACVFGAALAHAIRVSFTAFQRFDLPAPPATPSLAPSPPPTTPGPAHTLPALPDTTVKISEYIHTHVIVSLFIKLFILEQAYTQFHLSLISGLVCSHYRGLRMR